jgi:hypothetical protein
MPGTVPGCVEGQGEIPRISKALLSLPRAASGSVQEASFIEGWLTTLVGS